MMTKFNRASKGIDEEFRDPLANFDPVSYEDPVQQALAETPVTAMKSAECPTLSNTASVAEAVKALGQTDQACLLIESGGELQGVLTDRDILQRAAMDYAKISQQPVSTIMTTSPVSVLDTDPVAAALSVMAVGGHRHVPIVSADGQIQGILGPIQLTRFVQEQLKAM